MTMKETYDKLKRIITEQGYRVDDYDSYQLNILAWGLLMGNNITPYMSPLYDMYQMEQLSEGSIYGVDISKYNNLEYSGMQMQQLKMALMRDVDISKFNDPKYDWQTMNKFIYIELDIMESEKD